MDFLITIFARLGFLRRDLDYHLLRTAMIVIFVWFGYDKWFEAEIRGLIPLIKSGPLISWTIPVLGIKGTGIFLGMTEWTCATLLFLGFWNKKIGFLGALIACATFVGTFTILPFVPGAWDQEAGGFPAMTIVSSFLLKDLVLLTVSFYLLKQDAGRVIEARGPSQ